MLSVTVTDADGLYTNTQVSWSQTVTTADTTAPKTTITVTGDQTSANTYTGPVSVTVTATDTGGSGVASASYTLDGGAPTSLSPSGGSATATFGVAATGSHTVTFVAKDVANNTAAVKSTSWTDNASSGSANLSVSSDSAVLAQSTPRLVFSAIRGISGGNTPRAFTFTNNGDGTLVVSNLAISGPDAGSYALTPGQNTSLSIPSGGQATVSVTFHPTDPTGCPTAAAPTAIGTINRNATLSYATNDPAHPGGSAALSGVNSCYVGGNDEPVIDQVLQGLGYTYNVSNGYDRRFLGPSRLLSGDEIISPYFTAADSGQPVSLGPGRPLRLAHDQRALRGHRVVRQGRGHDGGQVDLQRQPATCCGSSRPTRCPGPPPSTTRTKSCCRASWAARRSTRLPATRRSLRPVQRPVLRRQLLRRLAQRRQLERPTPRWPCRTTCTTYAS